MSSLLWKVLLGAGGGAAAAFDPSSVSGYTRDWDFNYVTNLTTDTGGTTPVTADGDPIGTILCRAGSTVRLVAPADASRATYKTAIQNGLSIARFDGSDDYVSNATAITADASQTVFIVCRKNSAPGTTAKGLMGFANSANVLTDTDVATGFYYANNQAGTTEDIGGTPANWNILCLNYTSAAALAVYINGGAATASFDPNNNYSTSTSLTIGATHGGTGDGDFDIGRVIIYSSALSTADMDTVFSGLGSLWGITVSATS